LAKIRLSEFAKRLGFKPTDLARRLREIGFDKARSPNSVLDEGEVLEAEARLQAHGVIPEDSPGPALEKPLLRKKKKLPTPEPEPAPTSAPAPAPAPSPAETEPIAVAEAPDEPDLPVLEEIEPAAVAELSPPETFEAPPAPFEIPPPPPAPHPPTFPAHVPEEGVVAETPPPAPPVVPPPAPAPPVEEVPVPPRVAAEAAAAPAAKPALAPGEPRPTRRAKKVGFIDPSKFAAARGPVARSAAPGASAEPHPTFDHDKRRVTMRGDFAPRSGLTSSQLKDREEQRRLRQRQVRRGPRSRSGREGAFPAAPARGPAADRTGPITLELPITVKALSTALGVKAVDLLPRLFEIVGFGKVHINSTIDEATAALAAAAFDREIVVKKGADVEEEIREEFAKARDVAAGSAVSRPPVITLLGHVDHGKTSLLDAIRKSNVVSTEAGGITQKIGAYQVTTPSGHRVTVIDTPGHEAFTSMRARGARATDIAVLVVAADDGVMPQTREAIDHARAAGVPIVVALNKVDKPEADPMRARRQLADLDLIPEEWGGKTGVVETAATMGRGVVELLERVALEAEILELRGHPEAPASGVVLEATVHEGRGIVSHLLVRDGTLRPGDVVLAGTGYGRVRSLFDDRGQEMESAPPSTPVEATGFSALMQAGDRFLAVEDLAKAREVAEEKTRQARALARSERPALTLENLSEALAAGQVKELPIILKADLLGSLEALRKELDGLSNPEVSVRIVRAAIGGVTEADVLLAESSKGILLAFNVAPDEKARTAAEARGIQVRRYNVIYNLLDDVRKAIEGMLRPVEKEIVTGHAEIRRIFYFSKVGNIGGCYVTDGSILRANPIRLVRDGRVVYTGRLASLKRLKDDAREVKEGFECGLKIEGYDDIKERDVVEGFQVVEERRTLETVARESGEAPATRG
jgi:translation initiation factor IF-2